MSSVGDFNTNASPLAGDLTLAGYGFSAITTALGSYNASSAKLAADQYQANVAGNNVQIAGWQASQAITKGQTAVANEELGNAAVYSTQRATMAANGVDLTEGSPINVLASTKFIGDVNAATINDNALRAAWGYQVQGINAQNAQNFYNYSASQINPGESGFTSLLSSAGSVAQKWYAASSAGVQF